MSLLLLLACPGTADIHLKTDTGDPADTGPRLDSLRDTSPDTDTDTGADTDSDVDSDTSSEGCVLTALVPSEVHWTLDDRAPQDVTIEGCAVPLVVYCPSWITTVVVPPSVDGRATMTLELTPGYSIPRTDACSVNTLTLVVALDAEGA